MRALPTPSTSVGRAQWAVLVAALLGWMFDGLEMGLFPLVARPALLELLPSRSAETAIGAWASGIIATFLLGAAAGGLVFGWLGDRIGRVRAMIWSVLVYAVFSGLCGFATAAWQIAVLRGIAALGMGGEWSLGVALVMEVWPARWRPALAGLIGAAANFGFLLIALVGLGLASIIDGLDRWFVDSGMSREWAEYLIGRDKSGWRLLMFVGAAPALLTLFIRAFVPESERWREAARGAPPVGVWEIFTPALRTRSVLAAALGSIALLGTWGSVQWLPLWAGKMAEQELSQPSLDAGSLDAPRRAFLEGSRSWTQIASAGGAVLGTLVAAAVSVRLNRRVTYFLLALGSLLICGVLFRWPVRVDGGFLALVFAAGALTASFYGWLPLYLPELFPTRVRATGQGFAYNFGRVLAAVGALGTGWLLDAFGENYARTGAITSLVYVAGLIVIWFCPETKGHPLPD